MPPSVPMSSTTPSNQQQQQQQQPKKKSSIMMNYFMVILGIFGILSMWVNLQHDYFAPHQTHQRHAIDEFQRKHFHKNRLFHKKTNLKKKKEAMEDLRESVRAHALELRNKERLLQADDDDEAKATEADQGDVVVPGEPESDDQEEESFSSSSLAGLNCDPYGGPPNELAQEMVYWEDIESDNTYRSPFAPKDDNGSKQYLTFESDHGGWNNIRMAMETVMTLAVAMGRTLVLPPEQGMYLLDKAGKKHTNHFTYTHFFHMERIAEEHHGLEVITMKEFLEREGLAGGLTNLKTGQVEKPPKDRIDYDGASHMEISRILEPYLTRVGRVPADWDPDECMAAFPTTTDPADQKRLEDMFESIQKAGLVHKRNWDDYIGKPTPIDGDPLDRMKEMWAERSHLCIYTPELQQTKLLHFAEESDAHGVGARLLTHFYAFLYFEDWRHDTWMKRFVRDHVRYIDEIQCAAARVVTAIRKRTQQRTGNADDGTYHAFHVRRGDFQYKVTRFDAAKIVKMSQPELPFNSTIYIATDERHKEFFQPFRDAFADVVFLDDFMDQLDGVNPNYFGMMDQLIASRSTRFFGCWFSTFTGYINRLRGYHTTKAQSWPGWDTQGLIPSWYYALEDRKYHLQEFWPVKKQYYAREFPTSWRGIDMGIGELQHLQQEQQQQQ